MLLALRAASSAASCAANGVHLREPLKPRDPALDHATALPLMSVMVTTVLLKVDWMCAIPVETFFLTFFFCLAFAWRRRVAVGLRSPWRSRAFAALGLAGGAAAVGRRCEHALARTLARARVGVRALPVDGAPAVTEAAVAAEVHQALDVHLHFAAEVAFDLVVGLEDARGWA